MRMNGTQTRMWVDLCSNLVFMFVIITIMLYTLNVIRKDRDAKN